MRRHAENYRFDYDWKRFLSQLVGLSVFLALLANAMKVYVQ
jgi:hypothetical protein